jgi:hypothetical protein
MDIPINSLVDDLARKIHPVSTIAARYCLTLPELYAILQRPGVQRMYRQRKAVWESDASSGERLRTYAEVGLIEVAPDGFQAVNDKSEPAQIRAEWLRTFAKIIGDGPSKTSLDGPKAAQFSINFIFRDHPREAFVGNVGQSPLVIEANPE